MRFVFRLSLVLLLTVSAFAAEPCKRGFMTPDRIVTSALGVNSAAYGDFDEDGHVDVAFTGGYRFAVSLHRGNGVFEPIHSEYLPAPYSLTLDRAIDLDRDGHLDLLFFGATTWARGHGDGSFGEPRAVEYHGANLTGPARLVDFDHDGLLDVVSLSSREVRFFRARGDGGFESTAAASFPDTFSLQQVSQEAGDFDGDGFLDVVRIGFDFRLFQWQAYFIWSAATASPATTADLPLPFGSQTGLFAVDLDGDGSDELLGATEALVALHLRNRVLTQETLPYPGNLLSASAPPVMADVDADGKRDLLLSLWSNVAVLRGTGAGQFAAPLILGLGGSVRPVLVDLDDDGVGDLAATGGNDGLTMLRGGAAILGPPSQRTFRLPIDAKQLQLADINEDGLLDVVANDSDSMSVSILLNDGAGWFTLASTSRYGSPNVSLSGTRVFIGDYDADGHADLAVAPAEAASIIRPLVAFGDGTGKFTPVALELPGTLLTGVLRNANAPASMLVLRNGELQALRVTRTGAVTATTLFAAPANLAAVRAFDLDADGSDEIAVVLQATIAIRKQNGATWETIHTLPAPVSVFQSITAGDFNGDRVSDLLVVSESVTQLYFRIGSTYQEGSEYGPWGFLDDVAAADVDGDSYADLVIASRHNFGEPGSLQVLRNDGFGQFTTYNTVTPSPPLGRTVAVTDVDRDGAPDVLLATFDGVELLRNVCVSPRVRAAAVPATVRAGEAVKLVVHPLSTDGIAVGPVTIRQNGAIVHQGQATSAFAYGTVIWTSKPLGAGRYVFTIDYLDQFAGPSSTTVTVTVNATAATPRRRAATH